MFRHADVNFPHFDTLEGILRSNLLIKQSSTKVGLECTSKPTSSTMSLKSFYALQHVMTIILESTLIKTRAQGHPRQGPTLSGGKKILSVNDDHCLPKVLPSNGLCCSSFSMFFCIHISFQDCKASPAISPLTHINVCLLRHTCSLFPTKQVTPSALSPLHFRLRNIS